MIEQSYINQINNTTQILQQQQEINQLQNEKQQLQLQLETKANEFNQQFIAQQSTLNHLQQDQISINDTIAQQQQQLTQFSHNCNLLSVNIQDIYNQILQLKHQIELIPISPIDISQITDLLSSKLDVTQFSHFSQDYEVTIQQLDANIQNLLQQSSQTKTSISYINDQLIEIDKIIQEIQDSTDIELIYNLKIQLGQVKELCTSKFKVLDYLEKYSYSNRILDFNHSAAIKSY
ncbi:hypothetical protein ABPG72_017544 [Tetrahymena utriculariae]